MLPSYLSKYDIELTTSINNNLYPKQNIPLLQIQSIQIPNDINHQNNINIKPNSLSLSNNYPINNL